MAPMRGQNQVWKAALNLLRALGNCGQNLLSETSDQDIGRTSMSNNILKYGAWTLIGLALVLVIYLSIKAVIDRYMGQPDPTMGPSIPLPDVPEGAPSNYDYNKMAKNQRQLDAYCKRRIQEDLGDTYVKDWNKVGVGTWYGGQRAYHVVYEPAIKGWDPHYSCLLTESAPYVGERLSKEEVINIINNNAK